jgi:hypothetical protein
MSLARLLAVLAAFAVAAPAFAQQQKARILCDNVQRGNRMSWIDNPMAPSAINRKLQLAEENLKGVKLELYYNNDNPRDSRLLVGSSDEKVKAVAIDVSRFGTSDYIGFIGTDFDDGTVHLVMFNNRTQKALWTVQSDKFDNRDRAAFSRTMFAECGKPIAVLQ